LGQSLAVFGGPVAAAWFGWPTVFRGVSVGLFLWTGLYALLARNPPSPARPARIGAMVSLLRREPTAWLLGAFYFLTFGGFVAFSIYLPTLLRTQFHLVPADAGFRAAGFVVLATLMRPVGGAAQIRRGDDPGASHGRGGEEFSAGNFARKSDGHASLLDRARVGADRPRKFP
jgi:NNP family nitrate/nitrite transporter-like MFS transporter